MTNFSFGSDTSRCNPPPEDFYSRVDVGFTQKQVALRLQNTRKDESLVKCLGVHGTPPKLWCYAA